MRIGFLLLFGFIAATSAQAAPSDLDPSFGGAGFVLTEFSADNVPHPSRSVASAVAVQVDGKLVAAGTFSDQFGNNGGMAVARYATDGSLDPSFGLGGQVVTDFPGFTNIQGNALVVQSDCKLIVGGSALTYSTGEVFALVRYGPDGVLDTSFGSGGRVTTFFGTYSYGGVKELALQPDGKLVAAGTFQNPNGGNAIGVARYNPDGSLDPGFGEGGLALVTSFYSWEGADARGMVVQPNGQIVIASGGASQFVLIRLNVDGTLDTGFGTNGIARPRYGSPFSVALQPDGKIVEVGTDQTGYSLVIARINEDGSNDTDFGVDGSTETSVIPGVSSQTAFDVSVQPNGKIVAAGTGSGDMDYILLVRVHSGGTLDSDFGEGGRVLTAFPGTIGQEASALTLQQDGRIVTAGHAVYPDPDDDYDFVLARYLGDPLVCGDITYDGEITASDALRVLKAAVSGTDCPAFICDAVPGAGNCAITASDALAILRKAVGALSEISCSESCGTPCASLR